MTSTLNIVLENFIKMLTLYPEDHARKIANIVNEWISVKEILT
jgi:hypothetical protein